MLCAGCVWLGSGTKTLRLGLGKDAFFKVRVKKQATVAFRCTGLLIQ